jgi:aspartyl-tRNA(Asn)/glutamyl-tRNA(Gln) amidotransferase subunit C
MAQTVVQTSGESAKSALRPDELQPCLPHQAALANAPDSDGEFFRVPKVIEK